MGQGMTLRVMKMYFDAAQPSSGLWFSLQSSAPQSILIPSTQSKEYSSIKYFFRMAADLRESIQERVVNKDRLLAQQNPSNTSHLPST